MHQKKVMVTVWWSAASLIHYSFLSPGKTITSEKQAQQVKEMHQKKVMVTVWWSAACLIRYSFLNPGKSITSENYTQQINEMP